MIRFKNPLLQQNKTFKLSFMTVHYFLYVIICDTVQR